MNRNVASERDVLLVWLDSALLLLGSFVLMAVLLLVIVNPPKPKSEEKANPLCTLSAEIRWQDGLDADVDLWVLAPGDVPVGYSSKQGRIFNLLRDDLGNSNNLGGLRGEMACARDTPPGTYCANVGAYRAAGSMYPLPVFFSLTLHGAGTTHIADGKVILEKTGDEQTMACFDIDGSNHVVMSSVNHLYRHIWHENSQ